MSSDPVTEVQTDGAPSALSFSPASLSGDSSGARRLLGQWRKYSFKTHYLQELGVVHFTRWDGGGVGEVEGGTMLTPPQGG